MSRKVGWTIGALAAIGLLVGAAVPALAVGESTLVGSQLTVDLTTGSLVGQAVQPIPSSGLSFDARP